MDATTLEVVMACRVTENVQKRMAGNDFGWKTTQKRYYYGIKLHLLVCKQGILQRFRLSRASVYDGNRFYSLIKGKTDVTITKDGGYANVKGKEGLEIQTTKPFAEEPELRQLNGKRVRIEVVNGCLKDLGIEGQWLFRTPWSLTCHVMSVMTLYAAIQLKNILTGRKPLTYKRFLL
jgi:hypothetical protein